MDERSGREVVTFVFAEPEGRAGRVDCRHGLVTQRRIAEARD
jgi:hypothetical protein